MLEIVVFQLYFRNREQGLRNVCILICLVGLNVIISVTFSEGNLHLIWWVLGGFWDCLFLDFGVQKFHWLKPISFQFFNDYVRLVLGCRFLLIVFLHVNNVFDYIRGQVYFVRILYTFQLFLYFYFVLDLQVQELRTSHYVNIKCFF